MKNTIVLIRRAYRRNKWYFIPFILIELLGLVIRALQVMFPEKMLTGLKGEQHVWLMINLATYFVVIGVLNYLISYLRHCQYKNNLSLKRALSIDLFEYGCSMSYEDYEDFNERKKYELAREGMQKGNIDQFIGMVISAVGNIVFIVSVSYVFRFVNWIITLVLCISVVINIICEYYRAKYDYDCYEQYKDANMKMLYVRDKLTWKQYGKEIRVFGLLTYVMKMGRGYVETLSAIQKTKSKKTLYVYTMLGLYDIIQRIILTAYVVSLCVNGHLEIEMFSSLIVAILACFMAINDTAKLVVRGIETNKYISNYADIITEKTKESKTYHIQEGDTKQFDNLMINKLSFTYPNSENEALKNISVKIEKGKKYGIVGKNGSGKTTFIKVLLGLYGSYDREISMNAKKKTEYSFEEWAAYYSTVLQDFNVYGYSLRDNITMLKDYSIKEVVENEAAELGIALDDCLSPEYEGGHGLSGGEGQKVALLRVYNREAPIVVLDEPTAALSPRNEVEFYEDVKTKFEDKTLLLVSHRLASCKLCDEILVFDEGEIVESGSHEELMEKKGLYYEMYIAQKEMYSGDNDILSIK